MGKESLSQSAHEKVHCANDLLGVALLLMSELAVAGGVGFIEHPEEPHWVPQAPSIWRTVLLKRLQEVPVIKSHSFDQGEHGANAKAPTTLLMLRMPQAKHILDDTPGKGRAPNGKFRPLGGRNADRT